MKENTRPSTAPSISNVTRPPNTNRHLTEPTIPTINPSLDEDMSSCMISSSSTTSQLGAVEYPDDDDGKPSTNVHRDLMRTLKLIRQERHLVADDLYQNVKVRMKELGVVIDTRENGASSSYRVGHEVAQNYVAAKHIMERQLEEFEKLEHRSLLFRRVKRNLTLHDDWTLSNETTEGLKTYYRRETDGSLSIKVEGELTGTPIVEQIAVTREVDLYHHWAPFCTESRILGQLGRLDVVAWQKIGGFGLVRDTCFRAIGCDSMTEDGCIVLSGRSLSGGGDGSLGGGDGASRPGPLPDVDGQEYNEYLDSYFDRYISSKTSIEIPPAPTGFGAARMEVRKFECLVKILGTDSSHVCMIGNVDPNISLLPQSLLEFLMKKMCARCLPNLQDVAMTAMDDPENSLHARRMQKDTRFYRDWLMPKVKHYCNLNGWDTPEVKAISEEGEGEDETICLDSTFDSDNTSITDIRSVTSAPVVITNRTNPMRSEADLARLRELKALLHNPGTKPQLSQSVLKASKTPYPHLNQLLFFSDQMLTACNGIPQKFLLPALFLISAVAFPMNFDKYLVLDPQESYFALFKATLTIIIMAMLALIFLISIHFIVINIAVVSIVNDIEIFANNNALANTRQLLVSNVRNGSLGVSVGIAALSILKSGITFISRILYHRILIISAQFANMWEKVKMLDADDRTVVAVFAEWIEIILRLPFVLLSALLSPILHHIGFLSRLMPSVLADDADYFFWRNAVYGTQVGMIYTSIFILSSICLINKFFISNTNNKEEAGKEPHFTLDEDGNIEETVTLPMIEEDSSSTLPISSLRRPDVGDDISNVSTVTTKSKKRMKKIFRIKNKLKKKGKHVKSVSFDTYPKNITTNSL